MATTNERIPSFLCEACWCVFEDGTRRHCACGRPEPAGGWPAIPYKFRERYLFVEQLGRGGMGAVFRAHDGKVPDQGRAWVAIKVVQGQSEALQSRFAKEGSAAHLLGHSEHFVPIRGYDAAQPAYLAMEWVRCPTLACMLRPKASGVSMSPLRAARIGVVLLRGVAQMHYHRIVHRDLKPDNLFIEEREDGSLIVRIADFGVWTPDVVALGSVSGLEEYKPGQLMGTPVYMSPEQARGEPVGTASDIHTVGSILWEVVTGRVPYPFGGSVGTLAARLEQMQQVPTRPAQMPGAIYEVLIQALCPQPDKRPDASALRKLLERFIEDREAEVRREREVLKLRAEHARGRLLQLKERSARAAVVHQAVRKLEERVAGLDQHLVQDDPAFWHDELSAVEGELGSLDRQILLLVPTPVPPSTPMSAPPPRPLGWMIAASCLLAGLGFSAGWWVYRPGEPETGQARAQERKAMPPDLRAQCVPAPLAEPERIALPNEIGKPAVRSLKQPSPARSPVRLERCHTVQCAVEVLDKIERLYAEGKQSGGCMMLRVRIGADAPPGSGPDVRDAVKRLAGQCPEGR